MAEKPRRIGQAVALACYVQESDFPGCCGILVMHEATGDIDQLSQAAINPTSRRGLYLYAITQEQTEERAQLRQAGFRALTSFVNPGTRNKITLYGKKAPARRRRRA